MKVAIVGSRGFEPLAEVVAYVHELPEDTVIVSGSARGVDRAAEIAGKARGFAIISYPADWRGGGRSAGFKRNQLIVDQADRVVAFWDGGSRGTKDTIDRARKAGKPVEVRMWVENVGIVVAE